MTEKKQIYKCPTCGNIVEVLHEASAPLFCCGKSMVEMKENTEDAAEEKHVPVVEKTENEILVKVGSIDHPMDNDHYIEWIELITENKIYREHLKPGQKSEARFQITDEKFTARAYCNLHGLWKN
jgi:superoxide reductase